jgi:DNA-binding GntR family transcriptional regulator
MTTRRIQRQSLPETLAASLRERILNGEFQEGDALVQDTIAEEYEVSRMPVREALRQLEACGLVALRLHRGRSSLRFRRSRSPSCSSFGRCSSARYWHARFRG